MRGETDIMPTQSIARPKLSAEVIVAWGKGHTLRNAGGGVCQLCWFTRTSMFFLNLPPVYLFGIDPLSNIDVADRKNSNAVALANCAV